MNQMRILFPKENIGETGINQIYDSWWYFLSSIL